MLPPLHTAHGLGDIHEYPEYPSLIMDEQESVSREHDDAQGEHDGDNASPAKLRPAVAVRTATDPTPTVLLHGNSSSDVKPGSSSSTHRNRSPYSRSHLRSRSSGAALSAPLTRAHSSPGFLATSRVSELPTVSSTSSSPMRSPARQHSPLRRPAEEQVHNLPMRSSYDSSSNNAIESIEEDRELDFSTPRQQLPSPGTMYAPMTRSSSLRRRPVSPLHSSTSANQTTSYYGEHNIPLGSSIASSGSSSPSLGPQRFNESYPSLHHYASSSSFSSVPSTPTSQRSRSPSISSLETIEDAPDLESEAIEAERIQKLKIAAEREERLERGEEVDEPPRRSSLDVPRGFGFTRGSNRERKRWSVCGGERRGDLDLETIWED